MRTDADFVRTPPICATREIRSRSCKKKPPFATSLSAFIRRKLSNEQIKAKDCNPRVHKWKLRFANWICTKVCPQKKSLILINDCPFCEHPSVFFFSHPLRLLSCCCYWRGFNCTPKDSSTNGHWHKTNASAIPERVVWRDRDLFQWSQSFF